jgi:hypothetical protein
MDGRFHPGGPIWLPCVILIIGIKQGAELEPNSFDKFDISNALEITFPFKIMQGRCILLAVT